MDIQIEDAAKLETDGNSVQEVGKSFTDEVNKVYGVIDDLKNSWCGESSQRFTSNVESFREDFETLCKLIGQFGELITAVGKDYQDLEKNL